MRDFLTLLIDPRTINILHRSIDNDTKLLTDLVKELSQKSDKIEMPYEFYALSTQTERKDDYITGKIGIGSFALNNNNHILTMLYGVRFKNIPGTIMTTLGLNNLAAREDVDHNSVMSWISALINAHVDIAKDPYISRLNVNPYTYNLVNTLVRTGFGKNTFYFTTQPIMKELAKAYMNAAGTYMADQNKSQWQLQREAVEEIAKNRFGEEKLGEYTFDDLTKINESTELGIRNYVNNLFYQIINNGALRRNANLEHETATGTTVQINGKDVNLTANQVQFVMYLANEQFTPYATSVSNLVKYSKIDTKKHGKSYIEQQAFKEGYDDLFFNPNGTGLFEEQGIKRMANMSYINTKTENAIQMTKNILKGQFLQSTNAFDTAMRQILSAIGRNDSKDVKLRGKISRIITAAVESEFFNQYAEELRPNNPNYIRDLVSESEEEFTGNQVAGEKSIKLNSYSNYDLTSYIGGTATITFNAAKSDALKAGMTLPGNVTLISVVNNENDASYTFKMPVIGANNEFNEIIVPMTRKADMKNAKIVLSEGKNTIYDRFLRLSLELRQDPQYQDVLDAAKEPYNMLLRSIVPGKTFNYTGLSNNFLQEMPDTYPTLKFVKLFNALDQNGVENNHIIDAWDELLHDNKHTKLKEFAEDLVVYAFVTSGDQGGFTKMFKQVPFSWRQESGFGEFVRDKISELDSQEISSEVIRDAILNNWFDNDIVRTYQFNRKSAVGNRQIPQFISYSGEYAARGFAPQYHPLILAALTVNEESGVYTPSIDAENAPMFIKIPRRREQNARDSQRRYTVYEKVDNGMKQAQNGEWVTFPIYVKVEPKGNQLTENYLMTEYGRDDSKFNERTPNREALSKAYKLGDFIEKQVVSNLKEAFGQNYADIVESMNYYNTLVDVYDNNMNRFTKAVEATSESTETKNTQEGPVINRESTESKEHEKC